MKKPLVGGLGFGREWRFSQRGQGDDFILRDSLFSTRVVSVQYKIINWKFIPFRMLKKI